MGPFSVQPQKGGLMAIDCAAQRYIWMWGQELCLTTSRVALSSLALSEVTTQANGFVE